MTPFKTVLRRLFAQRPTAPIVTRRPKLALEALEAREVPAISLTRGVLLITGSDFNDSITVDGLVEPGNDVVTKIVAKRTETRVTPIGTTIFTEEKTFPIGNVQGIRVNLGNGTNGFTNTSGKAATVAGGTGMDTLVGGPANDTFYGGGGNDTLKGNGGSDYLNSGDGNDTLEGGDGIDKIVGGSGNDDITGGSGNDTLYGDAGVDELRGDAGNDFLYGGTENDRLAGGTGIDSLSGDAGNDLLYGREIGDGGSVADAANKLKGGDGTDFLFGAAGADTIFGDNGNDTIRGGDGADLLFGGSGNDDMDGRTGNDLMYGGLGNDTMSGGLGNDTVWGDGGHDELRGDDGNDQLWGKDGYDHLAGGKGADSHRGGTGIDVIVSVDGAADIVFGSEAAANTYRDRYWVDAADRVTNLAVLNGAIDRKRTVSVVNSYRQYTVDGVPQAVPITLGIPDLADPSPRLEDNPAGETDFSHKPLFASSLAYSNVDQGATGSCYFVSRLAALAKTHPQFVRDMITEVGDGTYVVRFFNQDKTPAYVRVDADLWTKSNGSPLYSNLTTTGALWVALIEKAWAVHRYGTGSYDAIDGGNSDTVSTPVAMGLNQFKITRELAPTATQYVNLIRAGLLAGHAVVIGGPGGLSNTIPMTQENYDRGAHIYMVHSVVTGANGVVTKIRIYNLYGAPLIEITDFARLRFVSGGATVMWPA